MATSLVLKRPFFSFLLHRSLRPVSSVSRSFNTNAMRQFDDTADENRNLQRSDRSLPRRRDDFFPDVFDPFSSNQSLSQVLNLMDQFIENPFLNASRGIRARYSSRIDLPEKLYKIDQIKAEMKNGVLKVIVPKMKQEERSDVFDVSVE